MTNKGMTKQKKQLVVLGILGVVLIAVLAVPAEESEGEGDAAPTPAPAPAVPAAPQPAAPGDAPQIPEPVEVNPALSSSVEPESEGGEPGGLLSKSPFESFWALTDEVETRVDDIPPPMVTLNCTLTTGAREPVAVIDGQTRFIGDSIQGWILETIGSREIVLRSPNRNTITISMPLLQGEGRRLPGDGP